MFDPITADDFVACEEADKRRAAQNNIESARHAPQHRQPKICPCCGGAKVDKNIYGIANSKPCAVCNGTGKLRAGA